jgi:hypothetical protein
MQKLIRHNSPNRYAIARKTEFALFVTTSAALMVGTTLVGTNHRSVVDVFSCHDIPILNESSTHADVVEVMDAATERWLRFQGFAKQWREERGVRSSITEAAMLPSYQKIVGMGEIAVPLILQQLRSEGNEPDQWFWALRAITAANPIPPSAQGNFRAMAAAWLKWGDDQGYVG